MVNDLVSDMLTRIRNASLARHSFVSVQYSKLNLAVLKVLSSEGYIKTYSLTESEEKTTQKTIKVLLKYKGWWIKKPLFSTLKRISKPGQRVFSGYKNFNKVINILKYNQGTAIISTSNGVISHSKAEKLKKGGEILCYIG
jgi:small subunit ribosomal protein S8